MTEQSTDRKDAAFWALLVGIDEYASSSVPGLRGCVNDVLAMRSFLTERLGVPETQIRVLTNQEATRDKIMEEFQGFLINNPDIPRDAQILFHYSGHGSQMVDQTGVEPDGYNETLVPYDSRMGDIYDIPDKTLAALLGRLARSKGSNITVILDSCHSGSGTRKIEGPGVARVRRVSRDERRPSVNLDAELLAGGTTLGAGPSGWALPAAYVLLAACRDYEEAAEYEAPESIWHGALTYFTLEYLKTMSPDATYRDLHEEVATQVNGEYRTQMPQCEGQRDRMIFGGVEIQRDPFITVQKVERGVITLSGGLVHGLQEGAELALYPPETRRLDELPEPLATVEVHKVSATSAWGRIMEPDGKPIPLHARGLLTKQIYTGWRQTVALEPPTSQTIKRLRQEILQSAPGKEPSPYLKLVDDPNQVAKLRVRDEGGVLHIYAANGELLIEPEDFPPPADVVTVRRALESIVRYRALLTLSNQSAHSRLSGQITVRLRRCRDRKCSELEKRPLEVSDSGGELTVYYEPDHEERNFYVIEVINKSTRAVYAHIFFMSVDYGILRLYPARGQQDRLPKDRTLFSGLPLSGGDGVELYLPGDYPDEARWDSCRDYLKVILTEEPTDLHILEQGALKVPPPSKGERGNRSSLEKLLEMVLAGGGTRHGRRRRISAGEDWTSVKLPITVVRAYQSKTLDAAAGRVTLSDGLTLVKPAGFQGKVTVTTWGQVTRGTDGDPTLKPPPAFEAHPEYFQPLKRAQTRNIGPSGLVIAFDVDEQPRRSITPQNPLRLELGALADKDASELLPIIFDGEDYLLAGYGVDENNALELVHLPSPVVPTDESGQPTKRGIARTLRLFIYKKMGRKTNDIGLRTARLDNGKVSYNEPQPKQFKPGDKVALFVHGFTSDTAWMIKDPAQFLQQEVLSYDHFLTWDYESFGTHVNENGAKLAQALQGVGFASDDQITLHVYAHSMGGVVSRCMIELSGGHEFVDRLVLAGAPNNGTTLAGTTRGGAYLLAAMMNRWSLIPPIGVLNWALKEFRKQGRGMKDVEVDSPLAQQLRALAQPPQVSYLVLAGKYKPDSQEEKSRLKRLADKILTSSTEAFFGEDNDLVIGLSSMTKVRASQSTNLTVQEVPSDHFRYFATPECRQLLKEWIS